MTIKTFASLGLLILSLSVQSQNTVDSMSFYKDYFPGTNDINGKYLGSTETMAIVQHKGKLYAGMGNWMDYPVTVQSEGTQILRKDFHNSTWVVDTTLGYSSLRSESLKSIFFTKDYNNQILNPTINLLVGGFSDVLNPKIAGIWVRNDLTNQWYKNNILQFTSEAGVRSMVVHTDQITGKQYLFAGLSSGSIVKAQYNSNAVGFLNIDTTQELSGQGRVMAMCVCNGSLYAASGVDIVGSDTVGGLYKRVDGLNPSWELVYRWTYVPPIGGSADERNIMRGITCVPDPLGSNNDVIIGTRANGGVVEVIQPFNNHNVYTEFNIKTFFGNEWYGGSYPTSNAPSLSAYNEFYKDTINGNPIWWLSLWVKHPNFTQHPYNGSYFLQRSINGTYKYGHIYDNANPLNSNEELRACRTICKSPFLQDSNSVYYFGGYDCAADTSNNTSWIYKGVLASLTTGIADISDTHKLIIYPNPSNNVVNISIPTLDKYQIDITNSVGQIIMTVQNVSKIDISTLSNGLYFISLKQGHRMYLEKLIKQ